MVDECARLCNHVHQHSANHSNNHVFIENSNKYCCVDAQPGRAERGVQSGLHRLKYGFPSKEWDPIHRVLKRAEYAFNRYMDTEIIQHISCARSRVKFKKCSHVHHRHKRNRQGITMDSVLELMFT
jgi:hypothetical protein